MPEPQRLPAYDDHGINLADPHDRRGHKTDYISELQAMALRRHLGHGQGRALDVGCGYGRMCDAIAALGYQVTGVEPSLRVLRTAARLRPQHHWCVGAMPALPFAPASFELVCLLNVARALHLLGAAEICASLPPLLKPGGRLAVIENLRANHPSYLPEPWFDQTFARQGLRRVAKVPIRASRRPMIYLIRYGLVSPRHFAGIAARELQRMAGVTRTPRWSYHNVLFVYQKA